MKRHFHALRVFFVGAVALVLAATGFAAEFSVARIYIEYNSTPSDLGFHVSLDGEDWKALRIVNPEGKTIFQVAGRGPYKQLGMTELFFEGAEPALSEFPLNDLLALMPEGTYTFIGTTVDDVPITRTATLTHAVPAGPPVRADLDEHSITIRWRAVNQPPEGFPDRPIQIVAYQIIVEAFQVTLPATSRRVTLPREFVKSLKRGEHLFEVLAIEASGNQTITEGSFVIGKEKEGEGGD